MTQKYTHVPEKLDTYVKWGHYDTVSKILKSNVFYPVWITGLSGNGKTTMVEQICAELNKKYIRVNFTNETDETDLIGSKALSEGNTVYEEGVIVKAMRDGAVLLLDEVDAANENKILCLQSVLEGRGVLIKATGEFVKPEKGFTVIATSNTKGSGSSDGKFIGTNIMNGAFLDRFCGMFEQEYPPKEVETDILGRHAFTFFPEEYKNFILSLLQAKQNFISAKSGNDPKALSKAKTEYENVKSTNTKYVELHKNLAQFVSYIVDWANGTREQYESGDLEEIITTRTLLNIITSVLGLGLTKEKSIELVCSRYESSTKESMLQFYKTIDGTWDKQLDLL